MRASAILLLTTVTLIACGPKQDPARPQPRPEPRPRVQVDPVERLRSVMAAWVKQLRDDTAKSEGVDLKAVLTAQVKGTPFARKISCTGRVTAVGIVATKGLGTPRKRGSKAPYPAFFAYSLPVPSPVPPAKGGVKIQVEPADCLVRIARIKGKLTLVAEPTQRGNPSHSIDKARLLNRGKCRLLELTTSYKRVDKVRGETETQEALDFIAVGSGKPESLDSFTTSSDTGGHGNYSASGYGVVLWVQVAKRHYLTYQSTFTEMSYHNNMRPKTKKRVTVQRLTKGCDLVPIDALELERLRKLPGGADLPNALMEPDED